MMMMTTGEKAESFCNETKKVFVCVKVCVSLEKRESEGEMAFWWCVLCGFPETTERLRRKFIFLVLISPFSFSFEGN
jgi:hypothetical protein